jgi:predicted DNA-binding ribbon-helix-helix protein
MRTTVDIPDTAHRRLKLLAQARGVNLGTLLVELSDQALGLHTEPELGSLRSPVTGFLKLRAGRPVTAAELRELDE